MAKRYGAEFLGTFAIVFSPVAVSAAGGNLVAAALVSGLSVMGMIYALGPISAAHFNPAVTLGFAAAGRFPGRQIWPYVIAQVGGAILAAAIAALLFGPGHGAHVPASANVLRNAGTELLLSFFLMLVIIAVATDRRVSSTVPALAIGFTVVSGVFIGGPITGGSMNPARSLGPALFAGGAALANLWLYLVVPPIGAVLAARVYEALRLHPEHATGAPNELLEALRALATNPDRR